MPLQQIAAEFLVVRLHPVVVLWQLQTSGHRGGHVGRPADDFLHFLGELRRVRRLDDDGGGGADGLRGAPVEEALPRSRRFSRVGVLGEEVVPDRQWPSPGTACVEAEERVAVVLNLEAAYSSNRAVYSFRQC